MAYLGPEKYYATPEKAEPLPVGKQLESAAMAVAETASDLARLGLRVIDTSAAARDAQDDLEAADARYHKAVSEYADLASDLGLSVPRPVEARSR
jgi:hypothetical protein